MFSRSSIADPLNVTYSLCEKLNQEKYLRDKFISLQNSSIPLINIVSFFQNILKHYSKSDLGYSKLKAAFDHMTDMSHQINEMKRKHEDAVRVQEIQSQLEDYDGEDFTRLGELVLEVVSDYIVSSLLCLGTSAIAQF